MRGNVEQRSLSNPLNSFKDIAYQILKNETGVWATHLTKGVTVSEKNAILDSRSPFSREQVYWNDGNEKLGMADRFIF